MEIAILVCPEFGDEQAETSKWLDRLSGNRIRGQNAHRDHPTGGRAASGGRHPACKPKH
jgi:hypothetical protein